MKLPARALLSVAVIAFFLAISLPLNYLVSSSAGTESATAIMAAIYIILTAVTFGLIFYKDFY